MTTGMRETKDAGKTKRVHTQEKVKQEMKGKPNKIYLIKTKQRSVKTITLQTLLVMS